MLLLEAASNRSFTGLLFEYFLSIQAQRGLTKIESLWFSANLRWSIPCLLLHVQQLRLKEYLVVVVTASKMGPKFKGPRAKCFELNKTYVYLTIFFSPFISHSLLVSFGSSISLPGMRFALARATQAELLLCTWMISSKKVRSRRKRQDAINSWACESNHECLNLIVSLLCVR